MTLGNDCDAGTAGCKKPGISIFSINRKTSLLKFTVLAFVLFAFSTSAMADERAPIQKPYNGPYPVNEIPAMGTSTSGPKLKINGNPVSPVGDENEDVVIDLCTGTKTWEMLKEYTPWYNVNRFGFYTDLGVGSSQILVFSGPNNEGYTTTTSASGTVGLWLLNDVDGNSVYSSGDSYLFSERSLTYGSGANEHQWFMVYDVSAYKGTGATYFFETPTEDFTTTGDFDYLVYIDDDHTSSNFDHNDMILGVTCPEDPCDGNHRPHAHCPGDTSIFLCSLDEICISGFYGTDTDGNIESETVSLGTLTSGTVCFTPVLGPNVIQYIVTDSCGKADTCETVVTVTTDTTPPELVSCPGDLTVSCDAVPQPPLDLTATDDCDPNPVITFLGETTTPGACPQSYSITRRWEVSDQAGNADTCEQTLTVVDNTAPTFDNCPADLTVQCSAVPNPASPTATDNCGAVIITYLGESSSAGACPQSYTLTRSWEAADECGNADTCYQTIEVVDTTPPTFVDCPADVTVECDAVPPVVDPSATDSCSAVTVTYLGDDTTAGACANSFTITRSWEAMDECGNADTCSQTIEVVDTTPPVLANCPADVTVECTDIPLAGSPTATDACDPNPTINYLGDDTTAGACANSFTITRSWEAIDDCGNADTCSQTIEVVDTTAPSFVDCPADMTVNCDNIPAAASPSATDACDANPTVTYLGETINPGNCPYTINRSWEAIDACGNADTCTQTLTVIDNEAPSIVDCPADLTVDCDNIPLPASLSATDNCDANPTVTYLGEATAQGDCPQSYTLTRRWEALDVCGNADTCEQVITVVDTTPPVLADCPADVSVECDAVPSPGTPTATDNCDPMPTISYLGQVITPGACPNSYTITRSWEAIDACGNADTCEQVIDVADTTPPQIADCPADLSVECDAIPQAATVTATDNCSDEADIVITYLGETVTAGACPQSYTLTRKWEAIDECGNADTCEQVIDVADTTPPEFTDCPADESAECDAIPNPATPSATDNCGNVTVTYLGETTTPGNCPQSYTLTRRWEAMDECGNADTCSQNIDVVDVTPPVLSNCPADETVDCDNIPDPGTPDIVDNCDPNPNVSYLGQTVTPGNCPYTIVRSWEGIDACGNADTCYQTLTVIDNEAPTFVNCPTTVDTISCTEPVPDPVAPEAEDNCDTDPAVTPLPDEVTPGSCPQNSIILRRWVATDICGNADTCEHMIVVVDRSMPMCSVPNDTTINLCDTATICFPISATDSCDPNPTCSQIAGDGSYSNGMWCYAAMAGTEDVQAIFQCTDACGNSCVDTVNIHLVVNTPPQISVNVGSPVTLCDAGDTVCVPYTVIDPDNGHTFQTNIGWVDQANGMVCFEADTTGSYCNVLTVTDSCGLSDEVSYCVQVNVCSVPNLGADSTKDFGFVCTPVNGSFKLRSFSGCGPLTWRVDGNEAPSDTMISYNVGYCNDFNRTWSISVTDGCGRMDSYSVTIRAEVNCPPQVSCPGSLEEIRVCSLNTFVCIPGDGFDCDDQDNNGVSSTLNGQPYTLGNTFCFTATSEGLKTFTLICTDACGAADTCTATVDVIVDPSVCSDGCLTASIEKVHNTIQGQYETVAVTIDTMPFAIGGLDFLIEYDASALSLATVNPGSFITGCGWEYFTYRNGASGNCGNGACPSGKLRIIAIGEINNGSNHPTCLQAEPAHIADLQFLVTNDRNFECQYVPIRFCWYDCGDNTVSAEDGEVLYISRKVYDYYDGASWTEITNLAAPFPSLYGANATCDVQLDEGKPEPERCIDFYNGGIDIVCADSIDDRGDLNMNNLPYEVSDAVLMGNYFIYGLSVFTVNIQGQIAASDVNYDGVVLSVADLVYLIRVVVGDAQPYSKTTVPVNVRMSQSEDGVLSISDGIEIGAAFVVAAGQVSPTLLAGQMQMDYHYDGVNTRILVWSTAGNSFTGDFVQIDGDLTTIELATSEGNPVMLNTLPKEFKLNQNYPNPFNPTTTISFSLPGATNYELSIYNISGQKLSTFIGSSESAGMVEVQWDAANFASGIYFYKLVAGEYAEIRKMMLIK